MVSMICCGLPWRKIIRAGLWGVMVAMASMSLKSLHQPVMATATVLYVAPGADCGFGTPNVNCYASLQSAVDMASPGTEVRVAGGVYTGVSRRADLRQMVYLSKTLKLQGGYTVTNWTTPDPVAYPTVLDAQREGRVFSVIGPISVTLAGFYMTGGRAADFGGIGWTVPGGSIYVNGAVVTVKDNVMVNNLAAGSGGGLCLYEGQAVLSNNQMVSNTAAYGGGLYALRSSVTLRGNGLVDNVAYGGGAVYSSASDVSLYDNDFVGNLSEEKGGALFLSLSSATVDGNNFLDNDAQGDGGGLHFYDTSARLEANTIRGNRTAASGGGLSLWRYSEVALYNNIIAENRARTSGSGMYMRGATAHLFHTTVAYNDPDRGQAIYVTGYAEQTDVVHGFVALTNTIFANHAVGVYVDAHAGARLESTLWSGNTRDMVGSETFLVQKHPYRGDPGFMNPDVGDYHIDAHSRALDVGVVSPIVRDIDGDQRPKEGGADLGADEYKPSNGRILYVAPEGDCGSYTFTVDCYDNIQVAVDRAPSGSEVRVAAGTYTSINQRGGLRQMVYLSKTLTLRGGYTMTNWLTPTPHINTTVLDAQGQGRVLYITGDIYPTIEGLYLVNGDARRLSGHAAHGSGGGAYVFMAHAMMKHNFILHHVAEYGGGIYFDHSHAHLDASFVLDNKATAHGGGVYVHASRVSFNANEIRNNHAEGKGGGVFFAHGSDARLHNTVVANNQAISGGGLYVMGSAPQLLHTTLAYNHYQGVGIGSYVMPRGGIDSTAAFSNTIISNHGTAVVVDKDNTVKLESTLWYENDVNVVGPGKIQQTRAYFGAPNFVAPLAGDYHIYEDSAALDVGVATEVRDDIDGEVRPVGEGYDLGADEHVVRPINLTVPEGPVTFGETPEYATLVWNDPWDMSDALDVRQLDSPHCVWPNHFDDSMICSPGMWCGQANHDNPDLFLLHPGYSGALHVGRNGHVRAIDADMYTQLTFRMYIEAVAADDPGFQVVWTNGTVADIGADEARYGGTVLYKTYPGWNIYTIDLSLYKDAAAPDPHRGDLPWAGQITGLRLDPGFVGLRGKVVKLDWVRLSVPETRPIRWAPNRSRFATLKLKAFGLEAPLRMYQVFSDYSVPYHIAVSEGAFEMPVSLPPGDWYLQLISEGVESAAVGPWQIQAAPTLRFMRPGYMSGESFASAQLNDPWDMSNVEDVYAYGNISDPVFVDGVLSGISQDTNPLNTCSGYWENPYINLLNDSRSSPALDPPMDTATYRYLTFRLKLDGIPDISYGWVARVLWSDFLFGDCGITNDIPLHAGWNEVSLDLWRADLLDDEDPCQSPWLAKAQRRQLRLDPLEVPEETTFYVDHVTLTANDTAQQGSFFEIEYVLNKELITTTFCYDTDTNPDNGRELAELYVPSLESYTLHFPIIALYRSLSADVRAHSMSARESEASLRYLWDLERVPEGMYYVCADVDDGYSRTTWYSETPVYITAP